MTADRPATFRPVGPDGEPDPAAEPFVLAGDVHELAVAAGLYEAVNERVGSLLDHYEEEVLAAADLAAAADALDEAVAERVPGEGPWRLRTGWQVQPEAGELAVEVDAAGARAALGALAAFLRRCGEAGTDVHASL